MGAPALPPSVTASLAEECLAREGSLWLTVASTSMLPFLAPGDAILITPEAPGLGAIVTYREGSRLVTHRVVGRRRDQWCVKGDGAGSVEWVGADRILGRACRVRGSRGEGDLTRALGRVIDRLAAAYSRAMALSLGDHWLTPRFRWRRRLLLAPLYVLRGLGRG